MDHAGRGELALNAGKPDEAIKHYTEAIKESPSALAYYLKRSTAYQRVSKYEEAFADANVAVLLAVKRAKRELIGQAQLRRAIALWHLERYGDAQFALGLAKKYDDKEKTIGIWESKLKTKMNTLEEGDEKRKVTITEKPDVEIPDAQVHAKIAPEKQASGTPRGEAEVATAAPTLAAAPGAQTPADKIRHDWYQNNEFVIISLMAKGVPKNDTSIDIQDTSVSVSFPLNSGSSYDFTLEPLFSSIDPSTSTTKILSTKIEISLKKSTPGQKWASLEGSDLNDAAKPIASTAPVYPTSSRTGPKNWDKIASSYQKTNTVPKKDAKDEAGDAKSSENKNKQEDVTIGDGLDDEGGDPAHAFFKQLYAGASDETRRAMMKSYQESGGTALSTNWEEVSKKRMEVTPPDGMVEKKW